MDGSESQVIQQIIQVNSNQDEYLCKVLGSNFQNLLSIPRNEISSVSILRRNYPNLSNAAQHFKTRCLLGKRQNSDKSENQYFVKYEGFPSVFGTWENESVFQHEDVEKFESRKTKEQNRFYSPYDREILTLLIHRILFHQPTVLNTTTDLYYIAVLFSRYSKENNGHDFILTTNNIDRCISFLYLNTSANLIPLDGVSLEENIYMINELHDNSETAFNIFIMTNQTFLDMKEDLQEISFDCACFLLDNVSTGLLSESITSLKSHHTFTYANEENLHSFVKLFLHLYFPQMLNLLDTNKKNSFTDITKLLFDTVALRSYKAGSQQDSKEILIDCPLTPIQCHRISQLLSSRPLLSNHSIDYIELCKLVEEVVIHPSFSGNEKDKQQIQLNLNDSMRMVTLKKLLDFFGHGECVLVSFTNTFACDFVFRLLFDGLKINHNFMTNVTSVKTEKWNVLMIQKDLTQGTADYFFQPGNVIFIASHFIPQNISLYATRVVFVQNSIYPIGDVSKLLHCIKNHIEYFRLCSSETHEILCFDPEPEMKLVQSSEKITELFESGRNSEPLYPDDFANAQIEDIIRYSLSKPLDPSSQYLKIRNVFNISQQRNNPTPQINYHQKPSYEPVLKKVEEKKPVNQNMLRLLMEFAQRQQFQLQENQRLYQIMPPQVIQPPFSSLIPISAPIPPTPMNQKAVINYPQKPQEPKPVQPINNVHEIQEIQDIQDDFSIFQDDNSLFNQEPSTFFPPEEFTFPPADSLEDKQKKEKESSKDQKEPSQSKTEEKDEIPSESMEIFFDAGDDTFLLNEHDLEANDNEKETETKQENPIYSMFNQDNEPETEEDSSKTQQKQNRIDLFQEAMRFILIHPLTAKDKVKDIKNCYELALVFVKWTMEYTQESTPYLDQVYKEVTEDLEDSLAVIDDLYRKRYYLDVILFARFNIKRIELLAAISVIMQKHISLPPMDPFMSGWSEKDDLFLIEEVWRKGYGQFPTYPKKTNYDIDCRINNLVNILQEHNFPNLPIHDVLDGSLKSETAVFKIIKKIGCFTPISLFDHISKKVKSAFPNYSCFEHFVNTLIVNFQLLNNDTIFDYSVSQKQSVLDIVATKQIIADFIALDVKDFTAPILIAFFHSYSTTKLFPVLYQVFPHERFKKIFQVVLSIVKRINKSLPLEPRKMILNVDFPQQIKNFLYQDNFMPEVRFYLQKDDENHNKKSWKPPQTQEIFKINKEKPKSHRIYKFSQRKALYKQPIDDYKDFLQGKEEEKENEKEQIKDKEKLQLSAIQIRSLYDIEFNDFDPQDPDSGRIKSITKIGDKSQDKSSESDSENESNSSSSEDDQEQSKDSFEPPEPQKEEMHHALRRRNRSIHKKSFFKRIEEPPAEDISFPWQVTDILIIKDLGTVCFEENYSTRRNLWNPGFVSKVLMPDYTNPLQQVWYKNEILHTPNGPLFKVTCKRYNESRQDTTPSGAWKYFLKKIKSTTIHTGLDLFGFNIPAVHDAMWNTERGRMIKQSFRLPTSRLEDTSLDLSESKIERGQKINQILDETSFEDPNSPEIPCWDQNSSSVPQNENTQTINIFFNIAAFQNQPSVLGYTLNGVSPEKFMEMLQQK